MIACPMMDMRLACRYGPAEAVLLGGFDYWCEKNRAEGRHIHDGRPWTYHSIKGLHQLYPCWSEPQIKRLLKSCLDQGALLSGDFNKDRTNRTRWYSLSDEALSVLGREPDNCGEDTPEDAPDDANTPEEQADTDGETDAGEGVQNRTLQGTKSENARYDSVQARDEIGKCLKGNKRIPKDTNKRTPHTPQGAAGGDETKKHALPKHKPERFERFWSFYKSVSHDRRMGDRRDAVKAWDKLKPDDDTLAAMGMALRRQSGYDEWRRGIGIPYVSTWLNKRKWEEDDGPAGDWTAAGGGDEDDGGIVDPETPRKGEHAL